MRRWNGWGDDTITYPLPINALHFLEQQVGIAPKQIDISLSEILRRVPVSRLHHHPLISVEAHNRLTHSRGQSFSDWLDLRTGRINAFSDGVAFPMSDEQVVELIHFAEETGCQVIPYGGGTSVVGHIDVLRDQVPVLTIDMSKMNRLIDLDERSLLATFNAGVRGPDLEAKLRAYGYTLGHFPQSFEYSTLGGWVATRSSGQQSLRYGRIEKLFAGSKVVTPQGLLELSPFPASAAGPDLREIVLGSEGRLGIITDVCVRISLIPDKEDFHAVFFPDFQHGIDAVRQILASGLQCNMLRLSTSKETVTTLSLAGHESLIGALERLLAIRGLGKGKCMLIVGFSGKGNLVHIYRNETLKITAKFGGVHIGRTFGEQWHKNRFKTPYLRNTLWELGFGIDTLETAIDWGKTIQMVENIEAALHSAMSAFDEKVHVFTHLSHVYPHGSSVYTTFLFRLANNPDETLSRWKAMKAAASQAIISLGGTISHQHGVGIDHKPYLPVEKGPLGIKAISTLYNQFDPKGIMNPGKLIS